MEWGKYYALKTQNQSVVRYPNAVSPYSFWRGRWLLRGPVVRLRDVEQPVCLFLSGVVGKGPQ